MALLDAKARAQLPDSAFGDIRPDKLLAVFKQAPSALAAAVDIQRTLLARSWLNEARVRIRLGLHTPSPPRSTAARPSRRCERKRANLVQRRLVDATHPAICARELNPSLFRMLRTWLSTVRSEMKRRAPICLLLRPSATRRATSTSRFASTPGLAPSRVAAVAWSASPRATATAVSRVRCLPAVNSTSNLALPRSAIADSSAWVMTGV